MKKVCIIGGGFAGLTAAIRFSRSGLDFEGTLIDKKETSDFLPTLPDCLGRDISPDCLTYKIETICEKAGFKFVNDEVVSVDPERKEVVVRAGRFNYDYLIITSGSDTNFYGNENIKKYAYKLDGATDAEKIISKLKETEYQAYVVGGGGYTGIEVATNLRVFLNRLKRPGRIIIVERAPAILGPLPEWMKSYVSANLKRLDIDILTASQIEKIEDKNVYVSGGKVFENAFVVWAAGVKTADFIQNLKAKKNPQGRIEVDEYLRLDEYCYVAGDAAYFKDKNIYLRMAVQFSIVEGGLAARNIINSIKGRDVVKYKPLDMGYIIPMANNMSCGTLLGVNVRGVLATMLHFMMCAYRSWSLKNGFCILKGFVKKGG
jgi:NADH dehydrogenase